MLEDVRCKVLYKAEREGEVDVGHARAGGAQPCGGKKYKFWSATSKSSSHFPFKPPKSGFAQHRRCAVLTVIYLPTFNIRHYSFSPSRARDCNMTVGTIEALAAYQWSLKVNVLPRLSPSTLPRVISRSVAEF